MLYSCTHMATVGIKGLIVSWDQQSSWLSKLGAVWLADERHSHLGCRQERSRPCL